MFILCVVAHFLPKIFLANFCYIGPPRGIIKCRIGSLPYPQRVVGDHNAEATTMQGLRLIEVLQTHHMKVDNTQATKVWHMLSCDLHIELTDEIKVDTCYLVIPTSIWPMGPKLVHAFWSQIGDLQIVFCVRGFGQLCIAHNLSINAMASVKASKGCSSKGCLRSRVGQPSGQRLLQIGPPIPWGHLCVSFRRCCACSRLVTRPHS